MPSFHRDPFDGHADQPIESLIAAEEAANDCGEEDLEVCLNILAMLWSMGRAGLVRILLERERGAALDDVKKAT